MATLLNDYVDGKSDLLSFYANPHSDLFEISPTTMTWNPELLEAVRIYNRELGFPKDLNGDEAVVITGQQPAVFGGPLYSIYKAMSAISLAERMKEKHGTPCVPVFWVGSEDHDFEEACTVYYLDKKHLAKPLTYVPESNVDGLPMYRVPAETCIEDLIAELVQLAPGSEFRDEIASYLYESLDSSDSLANWSTRLLARLFCDTPLVFFTPDLPAARQLNSPIIQVAIEHPLECTLLVNEAGAKMDALGYPPQVIKNSSECAFFIEVDGTRHKVIFENEIFRLPDDDKTFTAQELQNILAEFPERFSPNVALRCVIQQNLFPVVAYIAGPSELAYWGQFKGVFEFFGQPMPIVYPRIQAVLTTTKLNKLLKKLRLSLRDLEQPEDDLVENSVRNTTNNPAIKLLQNHRETIESDFAKLIESMAGHDAASVTMAEKALEDVLFKLAKIETHLLRADLAKNDAVQKQVRRLLNSLAPNRKPQERQFTVFSYLFEHGWGLISRLQRELDSTCFDVQEVEL